MRSWTRFLPLAAAVAIMPSCLMMCPYQPNQLVEANIRAECHFFFACCAQGEASTLAAAGFPDLGVYRDEATCVAERLQEPGAANALLRLVQQAIDGGRFQYDYATAESCLRGRIDAMNACDADYVIGDAAPRGLDVPEACGDYPPGQGLVKDFEPCFADFECATKGSVCVDPAVLDKNPDDPDPEDGVVIENPKICVPPIEEGDNCEPNPELPHEPIVCEPGTSCFPQGNGDLECTPLGEEGDRCYSSADCERGLFCELDGFEGTCQPFKDNGDDCSVADACRSGYCDFTRDQPECDDPPPVEVSICNGLQGNADPDYGQEAP